MSERPDIVVLMLDSVRADALSCYAGGDLTPNIDAIADDGLLFENAFAPATWTVPTHASLFTGAYPGEHGTDKGNSYLNPSYTTLAERLSGAGYETVLYSNNVHLTDEFGFTRGFDVAESSHAVSDDENVIDWNEFIAGRDHDSGPRKYLEILGHVWKNRDKDVVQSLRNASQLKYNYHFGDNGARATNRFLTDYEFDSPSFVFVNYMEAHNPFEPPDGYGTDEGSPDVEGWKYDSGMPGADLTDEQKETLKENYRGEIAYLDERIGDVYDELVDENTVFVVTADHGVAIADHGYLYHGTGLYNPVTKVPLVVAGTDRSGRIDHSVGLIGLYRTVCQLAGIDPEEGVDSTIRGSDWLSVDANRDVYMERQGQAADFVEQVRAVQGNRAAAEADKYERALVRGRHKYIREWDPETESWATEGGELYDYVETPDESTELDDEDVRATMRAALDDVADSLEPRENTGGVSDLDSDVEDRLQELGYIT
ncbi:sulfatase [Halorientalis litorea]|uniref:sulfatase n=1 Tax=Halorientalis litorea TaxID=2931977 RepID=UPI001FF63FBE|nr:sulfatase [Halorientalis litorea]